jgi:8-oxo-dGTP pyrophosphatase MutT (NUDIX family)
MTTDAIPAATLVLFRERDGRTEHLFVERAASMRFAAGAIVFPGGRVDAGDHALAMHFPALEADDAAARIAAIRETIEEAGVAIGLTPAPDSDMVELLRHQLNEGMILSDVLAAAHLHLDLAALTSFARWCPNMHQTRNFDTRFYIARAPVDAPMATVDATENVRLFWATAQDVLDDADAGRVQIIFPTRRNLERLAMLGDFAGATAQATQIEPLKITPWIEDRDGMSHLCIPDDRGYPVTSEVLTSATRG